jgi:hypothetical protein
MFWGFEALSNLRFKRSALAASSLFFFAEMM